MRAAWALAMVLASCGSGPPEAVPPKHVLFVLVDTLRADRLEPYGAERETSPLFDEFCQDAAVFENAVSQSSWTAPSMISMMTGREVAGEALAVPEEAATLAELFEQRGWRTGGFVNNPLIYNKENGFGRGFAEFGHENFLRRAKKFLRQTKDEKSFCYVHFVTPHDPYAPNEKDHHFVGTPGVIPPEQLAEYERLETELDAKLTPAATARIERGLNGYDDDVRRWDRSFGELVSILRETGQLDDTVIVIAADHGEGLWTRAAFPFAPQDFTDELDSHLKMTHGGQLYQELVHTPLVIKSATTGGGRRIAAVVANVDIVPTLCELADLPLPPNASGRSLVPALAGEPLDSRAALSATRYATTLVGPRYKLIDPTDLGTKEGLTPELYDLESDPKERHNIAADHPDLVAKLQAEIETRRSQALLHGDALEDLSEANEGAMKALGYTE